MGLSLTFSHERNTNGRNRHRDTRYINHESSITDSPLATYDETIKYGKSKSDSSTDVGSKCRGRPIETRTQNSTSAPVERNISKSDDVQTRKSCMPREWEWEPEPEIASECLRGNDEEERDNKLASITPKNTNSIGNGRGGHNSHIVDTEGGSRSHQTGDGGNGGAKSIAPRGKSWMIVTQRMMEQYTP